MMLVTVAFLRAELNVHYTPGQHHGGERHGQAELDVVAALALHCAFVLGTVAEAGVAVPGHAAAQRQLAVATDAPSYVWLRSSATCPLCRTKLSARHLAATADATSSVVPDVQEQKPQQDQVPDAEAASSVMLPVRLGRFKNADDDAESSTGATSNAGGAGTRAAPARQ